MSQPRSDATGDPPGDGTGTGGKRKAYAGDAARQGRIGGGHTACRPAPEHPANLGEGVTTVIRTLLLAGIAGLAWKMVRDDRVRRRVAAPAAAPVPLQRWEGEGGGVPVGAGQTAASRVHPASMSAEGAHEDLLSSGGEPLPRGMP
jgi:hypothetical protein